MPDYKKQFSIKKPCANCPFRNDDKAIELMPGRREQIIEDLLTGQDSSFPCHKTVNHPDGRNYDDEDEYQPADIAECAGAAAMARKFGRDTQKVQIAVRLGYVDYSHYDEALSLTMQTSELNVDLSKCHLYPSSAGTTLVRLADTAQLR